jgi:hypothetical protein
MDPRGITEALKTLHAMEEENKPRPVEIQEMPLDNNGTGTRVESLFGDDFPNVPEADETDTPARPIRPLLDVPTQEDVQ